MWQPNPDLLTNICEMLNSSQFADNIKQKAVFQALSEHSKSPEFHNYLAFILNHNDIPVILRRIAGLSLKSTLTLNFETVPEASKSYIKSSLYTSFFSSDPVIRSTTCLVMTSILAKGGFKAWPDLLDFLQQSLESNNLETLEAALDCIAKIIEDLRINSENCSFFYASKAGNSVDTLIPKLFNFCNTPFNNKIREAAILCLDLSIFSMPPALASNIQNFLKILVNATIDPDSKIRLRGYQGLVSLNETRNDLIMANENGLLERIIEGMRDKDYEVARNSISFWPEFLLYDMENKSKAKALARILNPLLIALLDCLKYAENDLMNLLPETAGLSKSKARSDLEEGLEEIEADVEEEEKKDFFTGSGEFTLRRVAGQTLERLAENVRDEVFQGLQFRINADLKSEDWRVKEAAILCLGVLSEGCFESIKPHLSYIIIYLLNCLSDEQPLIKTISCWTLSKFTSFIVENANEPLSQVSDSLIKVYLREILKCLLSPNQQVQESACSAFSSLISHAAQMLLPYINDIFQVFVVVFENYKGNSLVNLYGAIGSVFDALEGNLRDEKGLEGLVGGVMGKWTGMELEDKIMCPLMECMVSIINSLGPIFIPQYPNIMVKCIKGIESYACALKSNDKKNEYEKREVLLRSIDLLSAMLESLKANFSELTSQTNLYNLIMECIDDQDFQVRQFIFSFLGELANNCPKDLIPYIQKILPCMINNIYIVPSELDPSQSFISICNNAVWAIGEIMINFPEMGSPFIQSVADRVIQLIATPKLQRTLAQNFARCLGRLGLVDPRLLAEKMDLFTKNWCLTMRNCIEDTSKHQAFKGFFMMLECNQECLYKYFGYVLDAFANFEHPSEELKVHFKTLVQTYKNLAGEDWDIFVARLNLNLREKIEIYEN